MYPNYQQGQPPHGQQDPSWLYNSAGGQHPQYPPQQAGGYPPQQMGGYPPQGGYPPYQGASVGSGGLFDGPSQASNYSQPGYPSQQPGYPPQQPGYPPQQPGYPPQQPGYPSQQPGYPPQQPGYPPQQPGYPQPSIPAQPGYLPAHIAQNPNFQPNAPNPSFGGYGTGQPGFSGYPQAQAPPHPSAGAFGAAAPGYAGQQIAPIQVIPNPTLRPYQPFNPNDDANKLYKAMKGIGTDETTLIDILCKRTFQQRHELTIAYKSTIGKDLLKNIKDETRGNFELLFKALLQSSPAHLDAHDLKHAIDGLGTDELPLIDIICTKNSQEINELKIAFRQMYNKDLEKECAGEASGYMRRFLVSLLGGRRADTPADPQKAQAQAQELYNAGTNRVGTNEVVFNRIFATESYAQLRAIFQAYYAMTGHDIDKAIKSEMSGDIERAFLAVAQAAKHEPAYWAIRLHECMSGAGTHDRSLIRIIVQRSERDLVDVKREFQQRFNKSLESFIKNDCSGDYKRGLLCLAGDPNWR